MTLPALAPFNTKHKWFFPAGLAGVRKRLGIMRCWIPKPLLWPVTVMATEPGGAGPSSPQNRLGHIVRMTCLPNDAWVNPTLTLKPKWTDAKSQKSSWKSHGTPPMPTSITYDKIMKKAYHSQGCQVLLKWRVGGHRQATMVPLVWR